ncbi:TPM domain-containing protein [Leptobacterium meishanense]|uniref:TPM domain-containing protein n=1 Tax=Leptobacterium meishanense TaxID=3128904 RepID=UPI0039B73B69
MKFPKDNLLGYKMNYRLLWVVILGLLMFEVGYSQFTIPDKPSIQTSVYDYADLLNNDEEKALEQKLLKYSDTTSTQIVVVTIASLKGENIGLLAPKWGHEWGVGQKKEDNGVFILLAEQERKIWISPGYGVEDRLTAGVTGELIRNIIIPEFKKGSYYNGLDKGTDAIFEVLTGAYKNKPQLRAEDIPIGKIVFVVIFFIIIFFVILAAIFGKKGGNGGNRGKRSGIDLTDIIILSSLGRGGFGKSSGGSFGSGGGFSGGFGGGGFSGGGAGGSW